jgi:hypothetical protein
MTRSSLKDRSMSRVADLLEDWSKDPAYVHDFAALARELQMRCMAQTVVTPPSRGLRGAEKTSCRDATDRPRKKATSA